MSPFANQLKRLRIERRLRQAELAELLGYEQSYVSALEIGIKGPPTAAFVDCLIRELKLSQEEQEILNEAVAASQRKLQVPHEAPAEIYWLCHKLRQQIDRLHPTQISLIQTALDLPHDFGAQIKGLPPRIKRRDHKHTREEEM